MENNMKQAKSFIKKNCRAYGSGISFNKEEGKFCSFVEIESKQETYSKVDWWERSENFSFSIHVEDAITIVEGKIENTLNAELFKNLIEDGIKENEEFYKYRHKWFNKVLDKLGITKEECVEIFVELFFGELPTV